MHGYKWHVPSLLASAAVVNDLFSAHFLVGAVGPTCAVGTASGGGDCVARDARGASPMQTVARASALVVLLAASKSSSALCIGLGPAAHSVLAVWALLTLGLVR